MTAPVTAIRSVLEDDLYRILRTMRAHPSSRTDDADRIVSRVLARKLWDAGWRKRSEP